MPDNVWAAGGWTDYELLDAGSGEKLERWGKYILRRPDPNAIWPAGEGARWAAADAVYHRSGSGGGSWEFKRDMPAGWTIGYRNLRLTVKPMQFKHTGIFPEQAVNWDWISDKLKGSGEDTGGKRVLNLFAYTGAATAAAALAGANVCHVDAARGIVAAAKGNAAASAVPEGRIRYIIDDVEKFIMREARRKSKYDAVIMDPPAYGRGPGGELWKVETGLYRIAEICAGLLTEKPLFFIINSYAAGVSAVSAANILRMTVGRRFNGSVESGETVIPAAHGGFILPCGCSARWERA